MTSPVLPRWLDQALLEAVCGEPRWIRPLDVGTARRLLAAAAATAAPDLGPLHALLAGVGPAVVADRCVRALAARMREEGLRPVLPAWVEAGAAPPASLRARLVAAETRVLALRRFPVVAVAAGAAGLVAAAAALLLQ